MKNNIKREKSKNFNFGVCFILSIFLLSILGIAIKSKKFVLLLFATPIVIALLILIFSNIKNKTKILKKDTIQNEQINDFNNIKITKNNFYSLFTIKINKYQEHIKENCDIKLKIKPQLKNYKYFNCSAEIEIFEDNTKIKTINCFLNINGKIKIKEKAQCSSFNKKKKFYFKIIKATGQIIKQ